MFDEEQVTYMFSIAVSHEEEDKKITYYYSPLRDLDYTSTYSLDEAGNITLEFYNPDGKLIERVIWDADYNVISDEYYDDA